MISPLPVSDALDFFRRPQGYFPKDPKRSDHVEIAGVRVMGTEPEGALLSEPHWYLGDGREVYALPLSLGHALVDWLLYGQPLPKHALPYGTFLHELEKDVERRRQG